MEIETRSRKGTRRDDQSGTLALKATGLKDWNVTILSGDRDLLQLASSSVTITIPNRQGKIDRRRIQAWKCRTHWRCAEEFIDEKAR